MKIRLLLAFLTCVPWANLPSHGAGENEIGFVEKFALAADREAVLNQLVPGTEDYYFYHALQYQNTRNTAKLKGTMEQWAKKFPESAQRKSIENREALLTYDATPAATLKFLRDRLHPELNHEREARDEKPDLPTALDPKLITREAFTQQALQDSDDLEKCNESALEFFVTSKTALSAAQRRALLSKIERPDLPGLVPLILADLKAEDSGGFGDYEIHKALLAEQLDELASRMPSLLDDEDFVYTRLHKLAPSEDADVEYNMAEREAWLDRLWAYAKKLNPSFNTLKANILYQRMLLDRSRGVYDRARFLEYIKLPRQADYMRPEYLQRAGAEEHMIDLQEALDEPLLKTPAIGNDEAFVREFLLQLFKTETAWQPWAAYLRDDYLKPLFAEAKITGGIGDPEKWAALFSPAEFQELKSRVDIEFSPANPSFYQPGDDVSVSAFIKNVPKLIIKIYEINALSYFITEKRQLNTDLPLDGLAANIERTVDYNEPPLRRTARAFDFPELKGRRGAWLIELIGGGKSSRALIRKGQWSLVQKIGPGGDLLTVLDEQHASVPDAVAWFEGRKYSVNEKTGQIQIPFTSEPGSKPIVLADAKGGFATLTNFEHHKEEYSLSALMHIDREQLLSRREATLAVRTTLTLNGTPVALGLLQEPHLTIDSTTLDGITTTREIKDLQLDPAKLLVQTFTVPDRLQTLTVTLTAKVENLSGGGEKTELSDSHDWNVNGIDKTEATYDGRFSLVGKRTLFELLGKNGEPFADQPVHFKFTRHEFNVEVETDLRTDARGRIDLGELDVLSRVEANLQNNRDAWTDSGNSATFPKTIHALAGQDVQVPWLGETKPSPANVSLLEIRADTPIKNYFDAIKLADGFLVLKGLHPGDYRLRLGGEQEAEILIRITAGVPVAGWLAGPNRTLEQRYLPPLHIESVVAQPDAIVIQVRNANRFSRVHVAATRFVPDRNFLDQLGGFEPSEPAAETVARRPNIFVSGRAVGDEYRYILERRYAAKFPGNMLARPGLLLDPWEIRNTDVHPQEVAPGEPPSAGAEGRDSGTVAKKEGEEEETGKDMKTVVPPDEDGPNLDFLATTSRVIYNLVPDAQGVVRIDRKLLGDRQDLQVYAEDLDCAELREIGLPEQSTKFRDLRLPRALDPQKHFVEKKEASALTAGQSLVLDDLLSSQLQTYDSLAAVYALFAFSGDATLPKFNWLMQWPRLSEEEKRAKYSEFACHELNFFLARKDPQFFQKVIQPYLRNKKDKTFMDDWLTESDLHRYLQPWAHAQLNVVEKALLAQRIPGEAEATARYLKEQWEILPPQPEQEDRLFDTALYGQAMSGEGEVEQAKAENAMLEPLAAPAAAQPSPATTTPAALADGAEVLGRRGADANAPQAAPVRNGTLAISQNAIDALLAGTSGLAPSKPATAAIAGVLTDPHFQVTTRSVKQLGDLPNNNAFYFSEMDTPVALQLREEVRQFYRKIGPTKEWEENNYYQLPIQQQNASLVAVNAFWRDYAAWDGKSPFLSPHFLEASHNFAEMMLAMAVLDLPFDAPKQTTKNENGQFTLTTVSPLIAFRTEIRAAAANAGAGNGELLVSENFFRQDDRTRAEGNETFDKYVKGEFLAGVVYGGNVVVTNPTATARKVEVLLQIPQGALPVLGSKSIESRRLRLEPYSTKTLEYHFYFPAIAQAPLPHFPAHVSLGEAFAGAAQPTTFTVVKQLSEVDKTSWDYISQDGSEAELFDYLAKNNLNRLDLTRIAWRARKSAAFFHKLTAFLAKAHAYNDVIYSYGLVHNEPAALSDWLRHHDDFLRECGPYLASKLLTIDPVERRTYEHLEYSPLINQRIHRLGAEPAIANSVLRGQYQSLLQILAHKPKLDVTDEMSVVYYLLLQDRIAEALPRLASLKPDSLPSRLQYDYFRCYGAFYEEKLPEARGIAAQYASYPVDRWRKLFNEVTAQIDEIEGRAPAVDKPGTAPDREAQQSALAASEPSFDFKMEVRTLVLNWKNLSEVTVNYYLMDPEFLFSSNPFVSENPGRFSIVKPARSDLQKLPEGQSTMQLPLPAEYGKANLLIEILGAGQRKAQSYHANTFKLSIAENYGRLEARDSLTNKPVSKAYVKVYARLHSGAIRFFKDGYTDLRGKYDYASLNSGEQTGLESRGSSAASSDQAQMLRPSEIGSIEKFSLLILSESNGAAVREVNPPAE